MPGLAAAADLVTAILLIVVAVLGLVLNAILILTVLQNKGLRNPFTAIVCYVCAIHIMEYLLPLPLKVIGELLHLDVPKWSLGTAACKLSNFSFYALTYGVAYSILVLVVDRYLDAKRQSFWTTKSALMICSAVTLTFIVINTGVLAVYDLTSETVDKTKNLETCGLTSFQGLTLSLFFTLSYLVPIVGTFAGVMFVAKMLKVRKEFQLGDDVDVLFMAKITIVIFVFASYAILRLIWHLDRLLLASGLVFDQGDLVVQDIAEVLWYLHGVLVPIFVIIVYPDFKESVRALCCGPENAPPLATYTSSDDLVLVPVVTTVADPDRFDTWPQTGGYPRTYRPSEASLASTTISSQPESPTSPSWRVVRTFERPQPKNKGHVERVPVHRKPKAATLERDRVPRGYSSARSRSSSPASERREDTIKSKRPRLFRKKKSKKSQSSDEGNY